MKKRFTDDQIIGSVKRLEAGHPVKELARELGVTIQSFDFSEILQDSFNFLIQ